MTLGPSPHLSWAELACHDGTPYPEVWRANRAPALAQVFEAIRQRCDDRPIRILSAYRTPAYNARVPGAARNSQHVQGRALDLAWPARVDHERFRAIVLALARDRGTALRGVGCYGWGVHVDIRPGERLAHWQGRKPVPIAS